jgi:hypothetical protein
VPRVTLVVVEVTEADVARIPRANLRVPQAEFVAVWAAAEQQCAADWYAAGVVVTCRWLATATVRPATGRPYVAYAPVTGRTAYAYEELIEAEYLAAERLDLRRPRPRWLAERPGWVEGIGATLRWAWRHNGPAPIDIDERAAG